MTRILSVVRFIYVKAMFKTTKILYFAFEEAKLSCRYHQLKPEHADEKSTK